MLEAATAHTLPNSSTICTLEDLIENFKTLIQDSQLQEKEFLIYNGKLSVEDHQVKSIEIKISYVQQYGRKYIILIIRDTTQRDLLVTLQDNNKYKDQLLASVSHELRTPLNGNINFVESALQDKSVPEKIKKGFLTPALRSSQFLLHLINDILDMSQIKAQKLRLIYKSDKLHETLKNTLQLVELQAKKKGIELSMNIHPDIAKMNLCTDHVRLSQIVLNLLNNAIKFTQKGAVVLTAVPAEEVSCVKISIQDSGIGMAQDNMKKLFSEFTHIEFAERKEINPTGVGLGLNIAYNLAKLLGPGQGITVESVVNVGSNFSFVIENKGKEEHLDPQDLLINKSSAYSADRMEGEIDEFSVSEVKIVSKFAQRSTSLLESQKPLLNSEASKCSCAKILVVDDNPFNTMAFEAVLGSLYFKCDSVFDGKTAIEKVLERQKTLCGSNCKSYSVIFMDQEMPGLTGAETVQEIKQLQVQGLVPSMKIIGCTAHGSEEKVKRFMMSGLDLCIHKPITVHEIQKILPGEV